MLSAPASRLNFHQAFSQHGLKTWHLIWPVIIANMSLPLLNLADAAILGHLDSNVYLAGIATGSSLFAYVFWGFNFLSMGISGFASQSYGRREYSDILVLLKKYAIVASCLITLLLILHRILIDTGIDLIAPPAGAATEAKTYLYIRAIGVPAIVFNSMLLGFFVGLQNTRIGLYSVSLTQVLNIGLNFVLVFGFGFKTAGIAIGTVISEYLGLLLVLWQLRRTMHTLDSKSSKTNAINWQWQSFTPIFKVSSNLFIRSFVLLSGFVWFNRMAAQLGSTALASNALLLAFVTLISNFLDGTAAAAEAQTGHAIGQKDQNLLRQTWLVSGVLNLGSMLSLSLLIYFGGDNLLQVMTNQDDVILLAEPLLLYVSLLPLTGGIAFWLDGVFIGARQSSAMRNSVLTAFLCFVSASLLLPLSSANLWLAFNSLFIVRSLWLLTVFYKKILRLNFA